MYSVKKAQNNKIESHIHGQKRNVSANEMYRKVVKYSQNLSDKTLLQSSLISLNGNVINKYRVWYFPWKRKYVFMPNSLW